MRAHLLIGLALAALWSAVWGFASTKAAGSMDPDSKPGLSAPGSDAGGAMDPDG